VKLILKEKYLKCFNNGRIIAITVFNQEGSAVERMYLINKYVFQFVNNRIIPRIL